VIVFVRHGQTTLNLEHRLQGRIDQPLTDLGREQARLVAASLARTQEGLAEAGEALAGLVINEVLTSPLVRAHDTACSIADAIGVPVVVDERLIELDYGDWDGRKLSDVSGDEWNLLTHDPEFAPPGGESQAAVAKRVGEFCSERLRPNSTVVAVSHVAPIKAAVLWALGVDEPKRWGMRMSVASITRIGHRSDGSPFLLTYNEVAHLTA
jgi:broad specificity phosphatase PhoE